MLVLQAADALDVVLEVLDLALLFLEALLEPTVACFQEAVLLSRLVGLHLQIFILGGQRRQLYLLFFVQIHLLANLELQRLVLHLEVCDGLLETLYPDRVLLKLLVVVGLDLLDEMGVHVLDVPEVAADDRVHRTHDLLKCVRYYDQELLLVDLVVGILGLLALVLLDEGRVDALRLAEPVMNEFEAAGHDCCWVFLPAFLRPLLGPEATLLILGCSEGGRGGVLVLRLVRHGVEGTVGRFDFSRRHHCHNLRQAVRVDAIHWHEV